MTVQENKSDLSNEKDSSATADGDHSVTNPDTSESDGNLSISKSADQMIVRKNAPPLWKTSLVALKLIGLCGYYLGDNLSFLSSIGFLEESKKQRSTTKSFEQTYSFFATRSYFLTCVSGFILNLKEFISHRNGPLREAFKSISRYQYIMSISHANRGSSGSGIKEDLSHNQEELIRLQKKLSLAKQKHFSICISLIKSFCDMLVFSNSAGVDLHLKYRGRKMNEGLHSILGITSALTDIYAYFPTKYKY